MATDVQERLYRLVVDGTQAVNQLNKISKNTESIDQRFQKMAESFRAIVGVFAAGSFISSMANMAQKLNSLSATFTALRGNAEEGAQALQLVYDIAKRTGAGLDTVGDAMKRMTIGLQGLGATNQQIAQITENFIKLGRVGGSSMEEVNGALLQFGQALSSGVLQGDEFKSISEQFPLLMQKLATSLNVTTGQLKKMGSEGKLTADIIANVLLDSTEEVNAAFAKLPETLESGMNRINAAFAKMSKEWFNATEAGNTVVKILNIIADEIDNITSESSEWTGVFDDVATSIKQVGNFVIDTVRELKTMGAVIKYIGDGMAAIGSRNMQGLKDARAEFDETTASISDTAAAQKRYLNGTQNALDLLASGVDNYVEATAKLKPPTVVQDTGKAAKKTADELKSLQSQWESMFKKVQTPDEAFAESSAELDKLVSKLHLSAEAVARVRTELIKVRNEANEALRIENLTAYEEGFNQIASSIKETWEEAEQLRAKQDYLNQIRNVADLNEQYLLLAGSLGDSASAADQLAVAVAKVQADDTKLAALQAAFDKLRESGTMTEEQLKKVKAALGGLGESKEEIDSIGVAIGQTLSGSVSSFVDVLVSSEGSINDWFANLFSQIGKLLIQMALIQTAKMALAGTGFGAFFGFAQGAAFPGGMGLGQGVYNSPTFFKFAKGDTFGRTGVLGEAGPEAVVPLKRTSTGDLGVQASPVVVNINNYTDSEVTVTETNKPNGEKQLDVMIRAIVKTSMTDGSMDRTMRDNYNLSRVGR